MGIQSSMNHLIRPFRFVLFLFAVILIQACHKDSSYWSESGTAGGDKYTVLEENPFVNVSDEAISTFSIDADGASYANVRRFLQQDNSLPSKGAIRTEELINYFQLDYPYENNGHPINLNGEVADCPWTPGNKLVRIGIQGKPLSTAEMGASNFVFLIDVSGSMSSDDKLELLKKGFKRFVDQMEVNDRVAIVTYAGKDKVLLKSTGGDKKDKIKRAINRLGSGGGTNGADGIITAYEIAEENFVPNGNNRIIVGTDGDFNIGISDQDELIELIEQKRETGVYITVLGVGRGNLNDAALEQIANHGNGTYEYIDKENQLNKIFDYEYQKFYTVAKDVKVQVEFDPVNVAQYRLIGYENRLLETDDFEDDNADAGEIGGAQNITALYEIVPSENPTYDVKASFNIDFRYKLPNEDSSIPMSLEIYDPEISFQQSSDWMRFSAGVAAFSMLMGESEYVGDATYDDVYQWVNGSRDFDPHSFKAELIDLILRADALQ